MDTLNGKGAVVTGGASGIGLATAKLLAREGRQARARRHRAGRARRAPSPSCAPSGVEAHGVVCDVRSLDAGAGARRRRLRRPRRASTSCSTTPASPSAARSLEMTHDDWRWMIDVDLWGPIHGVEAFLPRMVEQGEGGHVLFTASFAGLVPNVGLGPYCVAKYGVVALAEVLYRELREHQIGVSVLCPMRVGTNIGAVRAQPPGRLRRTAERRRSCPTRTPPTPTSPAGCSTSTASPR